MHPLPMGSCQPQESMHTCGSLTVLAKPAHLISKVSVITDKGQCSKSRNRVGLPCCLSAAHALAMPPEDRLPSNAPDV